MSKRRRKLVVEQWLDTELLDIAAMERAGVVSGRDWDPERVLRFLMSTRRWGLEDALEAMHEVAVADEWNRCGRQVYVFDRDFSDSMLDEKWVDLLPDVLRHRPHDALYLKVPFNSTSEGVVVSVAEASRAYRAPRDVLSEAEAGGKGVYFHGNLAPIVNDGETIWMLGLFAIPNEYGLMFDDTDLGVYPAKLLANAMAYLCSANADVSVSYSPRGNVKRKRDNMSRATWHEVGYRIGAEIRRYRKEQKERRPHLGGKVRPHMRRAHFHHVFTGPRDGDRRLELRWYPPILVNGKLGDIDHATGHKVN